LKRLKQHVFDLESVGRYDDARRTRELLAAATEGIGATRLRLARRARHRANAESIRQKAEAMRDPQMRQHLLTLPNQFESMAESIDGIPNSKPVRRDTAQRGPQLQRQSDADLEACTIETVSATPDVANETRLFDLNIEKILEAWDNTHAMRELISNALDEQELTGTAEITLRKEGNQTWIIRDYGRGLRYDHFTQNESPEKLKNSGRVIGKFGIGLKGALATLHRNGVSVEIESAHCIITLAQRGKHGFGDGVTLHAAVAHGCSPQGPGRSRNRCSQGVISEIFR
jgi:hypothetical protein